MLMEERDRAKEVICLLCKTPFRIDAEFSSPARDESATESTQAGED
jgi:hypothetical protein